MSTAGTSGGSPSPPDLSKDALIQRMHDLEVRLSAQTSELQKLHAKLTTSAPEPTRSPHRRAAKVPTSRRPFDFSKHFKRFIALKIAYRGRNYNGFEWSGQVTPQPTIEEELWQALTRSLLIPASEKPGKGADWLAHDYSKCGRTDKGVSAFGQVIALSVRSARPKLVSCMGKNDEGAEASERYGLEVGSEEAASSAEGEPVSSQILDTTQELRPFDDIADELPYASMLNQLLPPDIRVLAWCPHPPPGFSARFVCRERQYKYFFTNPAYFPSIDPQIIAGAEDGSLARYSGQLDLERMNRAAQLFEGLNDFRNFCKVDDSKQITNFQRRIFYARIQDEGSGVHSFNVHGSAFLWHQVRHMVAILFLIGQGLEEPSIVSTLLDIERTPRKPGYQMAAEAPLVLWNCVFPALDVELKEVDNSYPKKDILHWIPTADVPHAHGEYGPTYRRRGPGTLVQAAWEPWHRAKIDEILAHRMLQQAVDQVEVVDLKTGSEEARAKKHAELMRSLKAGLIQPVVGGGERPSYCSVYHPVMGRPLLQTIEEQNTRNLQKQLAKRARKAQLEQAAAQHMAE